MSSCSSCTPSPKEKKFGVAICRERKCPDLERDPKYPDSPQQCAVTHGMPGAMHRCVKEMDAENFIRQISGQLNQSPYTAPRPGVRNCPKECPYKIFVDGEKFVFTKGKPESSKVPTRIATCALTGYNLSSAGVCPCNVLGNPRPDDQITQLQNIIKMRQGCEGDPCRGLCAMGICPDGKDRGAPIEDDCPVIRLPLNKLMGGRGCPLWEIPGKLLPKTDTKVTKAPAISPPEPAQKEKPASRKPAQKEKKEPVQQQFYRSSETTEHFTPRSLWLRAHDIMGGIDCDPASDPACLLPAWVHYTKEHDGLHQPWKGRVWLNPPFGRGVGRWFDKLSLEIAEGRCTEAVILWKAALETESTRTLIAIPIYQCSAIPRKRVSYLNGSGKKGGGEGSTFTTILHYFGPNVEKFQKIFSPIADIWQPIGSSHANQMRLEIDSEPASSPASGKGPSGRGEIGSPEWIANIQEGQRAAHPDWIWELWQIGDPKDPTYEHLWEVCPTEAAAKSLKRRLEKDPDPKFPPRKWEIRQRIPHAGCETEVLLLHEKPTLPHEEGAKPEPYVQHCCGTCGHHKGRKTFHESCPRLGELLFKGGTKSAKVLMEETSRENCDEWISKADRIPNITWCSTIRNCLSLDWEGGLCTKTGKKLTDQTYCPTQHEIGEKPAKKKSASKKSKKEHK